MLSTLEKPTMAKEKKRKEKKRKKFRKIFRQELRMMLCLLG